MTSNTSETPNPTLDASDNASIAESESVAEQPGVASTAELQAKISALEDALLRVKADYQNLQRRSTTERIEAVRYANAELMRSLLNALDDLDRALAVSGDATLDATVAGVRLVYENLQKALADNGLEVIESKGEVFDPAIHQALMRQPTDGHPPGTVIEQVARGYRLRDRVLRPARVVVAAPPIDGGQPPEAETENAF